MDSARILQLLAKQMGKAASDKEIAELKELLSRHPEHHFFIEILQAIESEKQHHEPATNEEELVRQSWSMLRHELDELQLPQEAAEEIKLSPMPRVRWLHRAAAWAGAAAVAAGFFLWWKHDGPQHTEKTTATTLKQVSLPYGAPEKKILPDSSTVWLNAGSRISYSDNFVQNEREVFLDGEAYFDVKQDAGHPFVVHVGNIVIRVLGTEFNVQAYPHEGRIETTLINGKVQVQIDGKPDKKIILTPNEKLTVINREMITSEEHAEKGKQKELSFQVQEVLPQQDKPLMEVAWLEDKLAFLNEPFEALAKRMERRYDVNIIFTDTLLKSERLNGIFENESIQKALNLLQMTTPFHYRIQHDTVYLAH